MHIVFDYDDVLASFIPEVVRWHNAQYGTDHAPEQVSSLILGELWDCTPEETRQKMMEFFQTPHYSEAPVSPEAVRSLAFLRQRHMLTVLTGREPAHTALTLTHVERHFPGVFAGVHFANLWGPGTRRRKSEIFREINGDVIIEDSLENAAECAASGIRVILIDKPWNRGTLPANVERVHSWDELLVRLENHSPTP